MKKIGLLIICLTAVCWWAEARIVKGKVQCEGKGIPSVIVTDGQSFTTTKRNGGFRMDIDDKAEFVYIITPSGYVADWSEGSPAFFQKAQDRDFFEFDLTRTPDGDSRYNIIAVGDPQPRSDAHFEEFAGRPLDNLCRTASKLNGQTVGLALGDICYDVLPLQKRWKEEIVRTGIPFYPVVGNHDHDKAFEDDALSIHAYRDNFGPENYAFFLGKDLMIVLDNIIYHSRSGYKEGYTDAIIEWVRGLMCHIPEDADIYVAEHSPLNGRNNRKMIINHDKLLDILKGRTITFMSGHNHINGIFEYGPGIMEHNVAAICGTWWEAYHCTDGTPRGYKVFTKKDGRLSWYYKSIDREDDFQYEVFMPGSTRLNPESIVVNIWDYDPLWSVEWKEDNGPAVAMRQVEEYSPLHTEEINLKYKDSKRGPSDHKKTRKSNHYFAATPSDSAKMVTIVIKNRFGRVWEEQIRL